MDIMLFLLICSFLIGDGKTIKNKTVFYYPLCERGKERITDLQSMSFELPELFKQAPCIDWHDYRYYSDYDSLTVSIPSVIESGNLMLIGGHGGYRMTFSPSVWYSPSTKKWRELQLIGEYFSFSPDAFLEKKVLKEMPIEYGFVDIWSGGRCARFQFGSDDFFKYTHVVQYYCWPYSSGNKRQAPFRIGAGQFIPKETKGIGIPHPFAFTDLDELIKPVIDSLEFYPLPDEALQSVADNFAGMCDRYSDIFLIKKKIILVIIQIDMILF